MGGHHVLEMVEPQAHVQGESPDRPLILGEEAPVLVEVLVELERGGPHRDLPRHAVQQLQRHAVVHDVGAGVRPQSHERQADFEGMRSGDVRSGKTGIEVAAFVVAVGVAVVTPAETGPQVRVRNLRRFVGRLRHGPVILAVVEPPAFEQQPIADGRAPRHLGLVHRDRLGEVHRLGRARQLTERVAVIGPALIRRLVLAAELVSGRGLPRQAKAAVLVELLAVRGTRQIGCVGASGRRGVVVDPGECLLGGPVPVRAPEPQPVLDQRSAERGVEIVDTLDGRGGREPASLQSVTQVVALQMVVGIRDQSEALERVAPVSRNQVESHASHFRLRREAAGLDRHFLDRRVVGGDGHELAAAALADVELHAVVE